MNNKPTRLYPLFCLFLIFASLFIYLIQIKLDQERGTFEEAREGLYLNSADLVKKISLQYDSLLADIYWIRAISFYGRKRNDDEKRPYGTLEALLDISTFLDPEMTYVYRFGATFLSEPQPIGMGDPFKGISLLDKGLKNNPNVWRFYFDKGFIYLWHLKDPKAAAAIFLEATRHPSAPKWIETLASFCLSQGGELDTARYLWKKQYDEAENDEVRKNALLHLNSLNIQEDIWTLEFLIEKYKTKTGRKIGSLQDLVAAGFLNSVPADPSGLSYVFYSDSQTVGLSRESKIKYIPLSSQRRNHFWEKLENRTRERGSRPLEYKSL